jgi:uracil-DNA glycosylase
VSPDLNRLSEPLAALLARPGGEWRPVIDRWFRSDAGRNTVAFVDGRVAAGALVYPARPLRALELTALAQTRVVVVGQDPYHGAGQAEGLAFSVPPGVRIPPSLRNIFKELQRDLDVPYPSSGHLGPWASQGVLLLNTTLTVEDGRPGSHAKIGWEALTDALIGETAEHPQPKVFLLWGAHAQRLAPAIERAGQRNLVLQCNHPSPLSCGRGPAPFVGCGHFRRAAEFLASTRPHEPVIDWRLP